MEQNQKKQLRSMTRNNRIMTKYVHIFKFLLCLATDFLFHLRFTTLFQNYPTNNQLLKSSINCIWLHTFYKTNKQHYKNVSILFHIQQSSFYLTNHQRPIKTVPIVIFVSHKRHYIEWSQQMAETRIQNVETIRRGPKQTLKIDVRFSTTSLAA